MELFTILQSVGGGTAHDVSKAALVMHKSVQIQKKQRISVLPDSSPHHFALEQPGS